MKLEAKRLFINNLPNNVSQTELEKKFADYGVVSSVEIKERKNVTENQSAHFAYVQLEVENYKLQNCIDEFSNIKWKGQWIDVQVAKESFMERLKRERQEIKVNGTSKASTSNIQNHVNEQNDRKKTISTTTVPIYPEDNKNNTNSARFARIKKYYSSSSEEEKNDEDDSLKNCKKEIKQKLMNESVTVIEDGEDELVIKNNKSSKIKPSPKVPPVITESKVKQLGVKEMQADKKRLQSIVQMKQEYRQQKSLIKNALANIDSKPKNKIIFDDNGEIRPSKKGKFAEKSNAKHKNSKQNKLALFEEADDENDQEYNFEVKDHFEGEKGRKLMELQSRFRNDKRFAMDARFLEDESKEENEATSPENQEMSREEEKQKQLDILEQVLGKKVSRSRPDKETNDKKKHKMMLRFDPSQPEHSKYEVKEPINSESTKRKRKESEKETESKTTEEAPLPEVSKDTFYKVAVNLKDALHENQEFSLASLFSKDIQNEEQEEPRQEEMPKDIIKRKKLGHEANPFRYDSSTDEESDGEKTTEQSATTNNTPKEVSTTLFKRVGPTKLWTESFFFKDDDYRLQEGFDFLKKLELNEEDDFHSVRRSLKEIVRAKVRNNQRNNRPFKRKLGGKKRIRIKRALKR